MNSLVLDQPSNGLDPGDSSALRQLLTHVPDVVINCDHKKSMPRVKHMVGVCMFADISGELKVRPHPIENRALILRLGLPSTLNRHENKAFNLKNPLLNRRNLTNAGRFSF